MRNLLFIMFLLFFSSTANAVDNTKILGVCFHPEKLSIDNTTIFELLKKYHFVSYRTDYRWQYVEINKGEYKVPNDRLDKLIKESNKNNITPLLILGYKNPIYSHEKPIDPVTRTAFVNYVNWVVNRYKKYNVTYEIYNEWWSKDIKGYNSDRIIISANNYLELIKETSSKIRSISPGAKIIAGSLNPLDRRHVYWLEVMMQKGLMNYVDGISIHPYSVNDPEKDFKKIDDFQREISKGFNNGRMVDIYITEMGYSNSSKGRINAFEQEQYITKYINLVNSRGYIKGIWWYQLVNEKNTTEYESNLGLLNSDLSEKSIMKGLMSR
ncbi:glycosyl hydrolase [Raoultella sp. X13]|uniref:glycosyl hydrolase n=1 Tax=Raoultella sp. X13 TaxID=2259647 RepID=UPI000DE81A3B|nr:glycosyl hydrolase [Raoultella sp. X13]AXC29492.1 hypothetical protein DSD31_08450 [Raoultella sp. X13]